MAAVSEPPPGLDLTETAQPQIIGALVTTWTLAIIATALRIVSRRIKANPLWLEDYFVFVAVVAAGVHLFISVLYMVPHGTGRHIWVSPPDAARAWALGLFISEIAYTVTIITVKWSTLAFYWRIFAADPRIRIPIWILVGIVSAWGIAVILVTCFQCFPAHAFWERFDPVNPMTDFTCGVDTKTFFLGNSIPNIITDFLIVFLPLPLVWNLQMPKPQKIALIGIFMLGTLEVDLLSPDITWNFSYTVIWTNVEANMAIVGCCLPSLKPILTFAIKGTFSSTARSKDVKSGPGHSNIGIKSKTNPNASYLNSNVHTSISKAGGSADDEHPFARLTDNDSRSWDEERDAVPLSNLNKSGGGITVTRSVRIARLSEHGSRV